MQKYLYTDDCFQVFNKSEWELFYSLEQNKHSRNNIIVSVTTEILSGPEGRRKWQQFSNGSVTADSTNDSWILAGGEGETRQGRGAWELSLEAEGLDGL